MFVPLAANCALLTVCRICKPGRVCPNALKNAWVAGAAAAINCGVGIYAMVLDALRTRVHSVLSKTNSLSLIIGAPTEKPNWLRSYTGLAMLLAFRSKPFDPK